ncbi:hypothetical protein [Tsukamurella tyrosinosolvens]|uniref:hypothetical protein n=1 Tax=Tsukamurella tyrosinosolvens TaxID=57704 RepID=UPI0034636624
MTNQTDDTTTTTTVATDAADGTEQTRPPEVNDTTEDAPETDVAPEPQSKREARYRTQLRETEAERDKLAGRIEALQRTEAERLAADIIAKPESLWAADVTLADLLDDDGQIDPDKVKAAAATARDNLGLEISAAERRKRGPVVPLEGTGRYRSVERNQWKDAFKQA